MTGWGHVQTVACICGARVPQPEGYCSARCEQADVERQERDHELIEFLREIEPDDDPCEGES